MKHSIKTFVILLCMIIVTSVYTGCGNNKAEEQAKIEQQEKQRQEEIQKKQQAEIEQRQRESAQSRSEFSSGVYSNNLYGFNFIVNTADVKPIGSSMSGDYCVIQLEGGKVKYCVSKSKQDAANSAKDIRIGYTDNFNWDKISQATVEGDYYTRIGEPTSRCPGLLEFCLRAENSRPDGKQVLFSPHMWKISLKYAVNKSYPDCGEAFTKQLQADLEAGK